MVAWPTLVLAIVVSQYQSENAVETKQIQKVP
jgi:hypothetical protein